MKDQKIKVNLQLFAETPASAGAEPAPSATPQPAVSTPEPSDSSSSPATFAALADQIAQSMNKPEGGIEVPGQGNNASTPETPAQDPAPDLTQPDPLKLLKDAGLNKFNDLESFIKSYKNMEQFSSRQAQENKQFKQQIDAVMSELNAMKQQQSQQQQQDANQDPDTTPLDALYEDPEKFIQDRVEKLLQERLKTVQEPIMKTVQTLSEAHREQIRNTATSEFMSNHPETANFLSEISEMIAADAEFYNLSTPEDVKDRLDSYLTIAKGNAYKEPPSVDKVLQDALANDELLTKYILGNETIRNRILNDAMSAAPKVPPTITKSGGNTLTPPDAKQPSNFAELGEQILKQFGQ